MPTLVELIAMRASLFAALAGGVREFKDQNGEHVVYQSGREMRDALASLDHQIAALQNGQRPAIIYPITSKGLSR